MVHCNRLLTLGLKLNEYHSFDDHIKHQENLVFLFDPGRWLGTNHKFTLEFRTSF